MTDLLPSVQAIVNAAVEAGGGYGRATPTLHARLAAALRAAANHCHSQEIREADHTTRRWICVDGLLAIAAELEGGN